MKTKRMFSIVAGLAAGLLLISGCGEKAGPEPSSAGQASGEAAAKRYPLRGVVLEVDPARKSMIVEHEEIPGFMAAMTMSFPVEDSVLQTVKPKQTITATLVHEGSKYWLEDVKVAADAATK